jgi:N-acetylglutamate synthase/N-acetylornithine aminotransferase
MQIVIDVKEGYATQFLSILQSLDNRFFNQVKIEKSSFTNDKEYLTKEFQELTSGDCKTFSLDEFDAQLDKVLDEYAR